MFEALLDVRTITRLLSIGGGVFVLGLVIWLVSLGVFEDKLVLAVTLGVGSLAVMGCGWFTSLLTRYRIAGKALTFLACVILPLNLWFYHAQDLIRVDQNLWVGGFVCVLLYAATVFVLREPIYLIAVELGITLTALLFLGDVNRFHDLTWTSVSMLALAAASIHSMFAFPKEDRGNGFSRPRFGTPLFWCGHAQLAAALLLLIVGQLLGRATNGLFYDLHRMGPIAIDNFGVVLGVWLGAAYLYGLSAKLFSKHRVFGYLSGLALLAAAWQVVDRWALAVEYQTLVFAGIGCGLIVIARALGMLVAKPKATDSAESRVPTLAGGIAEFGHVTLSLSLIAVFLQGVGQLASDLYVWPNLPVLGGAFAMALIAAAASTTAAYRRWYLVASIWLVGLVGGSIALRSTLSIWRKLELFCLIVGGALTALGYVQRFRERNAQDQEATSSLLWLGSILVCLPMLFATMVPRLDGAALVIADELVLIIASLLLLITGAGWQVKSTTLLGGSTLSIYLLMVIGGLAYQPNVAVGIYLAVGGGTIFVLGILLSIYRERLLRLPAQIANREGLFQVLDWR
jgi:hypothetical protein